MDSLQINFVTTGEFTRLRGVDRHSLRTHPSQIYDQNLVRGWTAEHAVVKSRTSGNVDDPVYTTLAQACTAGFLRVRLGMETHSHMMLHLMGIESKGEDPIKMARKQLPERVESFFNSLDYLIQLAHDKKEIIYIDYVPAGSIEHTEGQYPPDIPAPCLDTVKANSKGVREVVEEVLAEEIQKFQNRAVGYQVQIVVSSSQFTGQKSVVRDNAGMFDIEAEIPLTNMHFDPRTNILSLNAQHSLMSTDGTNIHLNDAVTRATVMQHFSNISLGSDHVIRFAA